MHVNLQIHQDGMMIGRCRSLLISHIVMAKSSKIIVITFRSFLEILVKIDCIEDPFLDHHI